MTIRSQFAGNTHLNGIGLNLFSNDDLYEIHLATLDILRNTGMKVLSKEARDIYKDAGCFVNEKDQIVKFPPNVVIDAINSAPETVTIWGRDPKRTCVIEKNRVNFINFSTAVKYLDPYTRTVREPLLEDMKNIVKACDATENLNFVNRATVPVDVEPEIANLRAAEAYFNYTTKPLHLQSPDRETFIGYRKMGEVIAGGKEALQERPLFMTATGCMISPSTYSAEACESLIEAARANLPVKLLTMGMPGATHCVDMASSIAHSNAEILSGIVLSQLVNKGVPAIYGSSTCGFDLRLGLASVGSPELAVISAGLTKMAQFYRLPSYVAGG